MAQAKKYRVVNGINVPKKGASSGGEGEVYHKAGSTVTSSQIPAKSLKWLLAGGDLEEVKD